MKFLRFESFIASIKIVHTALKVVCDVSAEILQKSERSGVILAIGAGPKGLCVFYVT